MKSLHEPSTIHHTNILWRQQRKSLPQFDFQFPRTLPSLKSLEFPQNFCNNGNQIFAANFKNAEEVSKLYEDASIFSVPGDVFPR